jgi:hypothetical protein
MSDFPKGGDIQATRAWLDKKGFTGQFTGWEADAILGQDKSDIIAMLGNVEGLRLWGFLNTARQNQFSDKLGNVRLTIPYYMKFIYFFLLLFICKAAGNLLWMWFNSFSFASLFPASNSSHPGFGADALLLESSSRYSTNMIASSTGSHTVQMKETGLVQHGAATSDGIRLRRLAKNM